MERSSLQHLSCCSLPPSDPHGPATLSWPILWAKQCPGPVASGSSCPPGRSRTAGAMLRRSLSPGRTAGALGAGLRGLRRSEPGKAREPPLLMKTSIHSRQQPRAGVKPDAGGEITAQLIAVNLEFKPGLLALLGGKSRQTNKRPPVHTQPPAAGPCRLGTAPGSSPSAEARAGGCTRSWMGLAAPKDAFVGLLMVSSL